MASFNKLKPPLLLLAITACVAPVSQKAKDCDCCADSGKNPPPPVLIMSISVKSTNGIPLENIEVYCGLDFVGRTSESGEIALQYFGESGAIFKQCQKIYFKDSEWQYQDRTVDFRSIVDKTVEMEEWGQPHGYGCRMLMHELKFDSLCSATAIGIYSADFTGAIKRANTSGALKLEKALLGEKIELQLTVKKDPCGYEFHEGGHYLFFDDRNLIEVGDGTKRYEKRLMSGSALLENLSHLDELAGRIDKKFSSKEYLKTVDASKLKDREKDQYYNLVAKLDNGRYEEILDSIVLLHSIEREKHNSIIGEVYKSLKGRCKNIGLVHRELSNMGSK